MEQILPVMLLKGLILLPNGEVKIELNNDLSKEITRLAVKDFNRCVLVITPHNQVEEAPEVTDLPLVGVTCKIKSRIELPSGNVRITLKGIKRVKVLDYLNSLEIENIIYSNWFTKTQVGRLKKLGLDLYFKEIIGADYHMKPSKEGFLSACGPYKPSECVMIGDNYDKDILGARNAGLNTIYYSPKKEVDVPHIKSLVKIKEMY